MPGFSADTRVNSYLFRFWGFQLLVLILGLLVSDSDSGVVILVLMLWLSDTGSDTGAVSYWFLF